MLYPAENKEPLLSALSDICPEGDPFAEKITLFREFFSGEKCADRLFGYARLNDINLEPDLFYMAVSMDLDLSPLISLPGCDVKLCAFVCCDLAGFCDRAADEPGHIEAVLGFFECCLLRAYGRKSAPDTEKLLRAYSSVGSRYAELTESLGPGELPSFVHAAIITGELLSLAGSRSYGQCARLINAAVSENPALSAPLSLFAEALLNEENSRVSEFERLAFAVKLNIMSRIRAGDYAGAQKTLGEYESINPKDPDILPLGEEIAEKLRKG